jgi:hypothetical protein
VARWSVAVPPPARFCAPVAPGAAARAGMVEGVGGGGAVAPQAGLAATLAGQPAGQEVR